MPVSNVIRPVAVLAGLLALAGCVAPPPSPVYTPAGYAVMGSYCAAGAYQCAASGQVGTPCACPGLGAPSYGVIR